MTILRPALLVLAVSAHPVAAQTEARFRALVSADSISVLHDPLARHPHVAGTPASLAIADHLAETLRRFGLTVDVREYQPWLSHPKHISVEMTAPTRRRLSVREPAVPGDPTSADPELGPAYIAYSGSGTAAGPVVYVNYGLPADYARLAALGVSVRGRIAIARYGRSHRAVKVHTAEEAGASALILYSDPADDGFTRGPAWPNGYWRGTRQIQRGNAKLSWFWHGDPLTPGVAALPGAPRLDPATAPTLPRIPVVALSAAEAEPLLRALGGPVGPAGFPGGLPFTYRVGPGPAAARVSVRMDNGQKPIRDVIATLPGAEEPDRVVLLGTHHDAWTFGGVDPGTGVAVLLETARGLSGLVRSGWRPRRSISFAFWDAEEFGLVGSTEYAEELRTRLQRELVAYINTDMNTAGRFDPGGVPSLRDFVAAVARDVDEGGASVYDRWRASAWQRLSAERPRAADSGFVPELKPLGSGADFVPFQDHLGIPTLSLEFIGENGYGFGTYHSNSDSRAYVDRIADPGFRQGAVLSQMLGSVAIRLADAEVLPFRFSHYARVLDQAVTTAQGWTGTMAMDFTPLVALAEQVNRSATRLEARLDSAQKFGPLPPEVNRRVNDGLARLEQQLTDDDGDPATKWYRHVVYGWNIYSLYDGQPFPGLAEAVRIHDPTRVEHEATRLQRALGRMAAQLDSLLASNFP